jgi:hypothetical protein
MYAEVRTSEREGTGSSQTKSIPTYLGKVIDLKNGLFQNRQRGIFKYTIESGYEQADMQDHELTIQPTKESAILDFGASYLLAEYSKKIGFWDLFRETLPKFQDSLMAMVLFYVELKASNQQAIHWFSSSLSSVMFPTAQLQSQRISELLVRLGNESVVRDFFARYLNTLLPGNKKAGIIIDSTGLPNAIHFPLTEICNHNGTVSAEVRLIYIVDIKSGLPLFFRYNPGNIIDVSTLKASLNELKEHGVSVNQAILDAGFCSESNIQALYDAKIHYIIRLPSNRKVFIDAIAKFREEVLSDQCRYIHSGRAIGIKRIATTAFGHHGYIYLCVDYNRRNEELTKFTQGALEDKMPRDEWSTHTNKMGFFAIVSSKKIEPADLLPLYYTRQTVEQVFDVLKNDAKGLPLRAHNEDTFRGHLMLSFMSVMLNLKLNQCFAGNKMFTAQSALLVMRGLKCKVYKNCMLISEPNKNMKQICKMASITLPEKLKLPMNYSSIDN